MVRKKPGDKAKPSTARKLESVSQTKGKPLIGTVSQEPSRRSDENISKVVDKLIYRLWDTINDLESIQPINARFFRVTIFGSARITRGDALFDEVKSLACKISNLGCDIVTGGGPGLMEAANEGAKECNPSHKTRSFGLTINLPFENVPNPFVDRVTAHRTFFSRLHHFVRMSHAFVVFPGGIGTSLETFMIWQLLQVKHISARPLVFYGEMWRGLIDWMRNDMLSRRLINAADFDLVTCARDLDEVVAVVEQAKKRFDERKALRV